MSRENESRGTFVRSDGESIVWRSMLGGALHRDIGWEGGAACRWKSDRASADRMKKFWAIRTQLVENVGYGLSIESRIRYSSRIFGCQE
jgi:hypothetical protein